MKYTYKTLLILGLSAMLGQMIVSCGSKSPSRFEKTAQEPKATSKNVTKEIESKPASAPLSHSTAQRNNAPAKAKSEGITAQSAKKIAADESKITDNKTPKDENTANNEKYDLISENPFYSVIENPLSTFSIDVDTASYSNVRRFINEGQLPPKDAVRLEEMINYFNYEYAQPKDSTPFSVNTEISESPWNPSHKLVQIGLQGKRISTENLPPNNLVFLI
ncbi:MAG TPA: von Willebrand factor type A domain-containing protein, partial [Allocoleopsis sp.]